MTTDQLLDQLQCLLSNHSPIIVKTNLPQGSTVHTSKRVNDTLPAEGVPPLPPRDPSIADNGVVDRTFQNPQFFYQDEKPSSKAVSIRVRCRLWLEARLSDGPVPLSEIKKEAQQLGFSAKALRVVRGQLGVRPVACLSLAGDKVLDHEHSKF
jgi:hypothetical protein